eukprot:2102826-Pyramimonas_sp.AAC.1
MGEPRRPRQGPPMEGRPEEAEEAGVTRGAKAGETRQKGVKAEAIARMGRLTARRSRMGAAVVAAVATPHRRDRVGLVTPTAEDPRIAT